jgi:hypothetical protein
MNFRINELLYFYNYIAQRVTLGHKFTPHISIVLLS